MNSLKSIAKELDISTATVSNALNGTGRVSLKLRKKIQKFATQLKYRPSEHARALHGKRLNILGMLMTTMDDLGQHFFDGAERAATERGFSIILAVTRGNEHLDHSGIRRFLELRLGGVLYFPAARLSAGFAEEECAKAGVPLALLYRRPHGDRSPAFIVNHRAGFEQGLQHLISLNHRKITMVYEESWRGPEVDIAKAVSEEINKTGTATITLAAFEEINIQAQLDSEVTAFFCLSDKNAKEVMDRLRIMEKRIPEDVSVMGFRDTIVAQCASPSITTLHVPGEEMGYQGAKWLIDRIEKPDALLSLSEAESIVTMESMPALIVRKSTGRASGPLRVE